MMITAKDKFNMTFDTKIHTASIVSWDTDIQVDIKRQLQGNWLPRDWSEGSIRAKYHVGLLPWTLVSSEPSSDVTSYSNIRGNYAGSDTYKMSSFQRCDVKLCFYMSISCVQHFWQYFSPPPLNNVYFHTTSNYKSFNLQKIIEDIQKYKPQYYHQLQ